MLMYAASRTKRLLPWLQRGRLKVMAGFSTEGSDEVPIAASGDQTTWRKTDRMRETEAVGITIAAVYSMYSVHIMLSFGM